MQNVKNKNYYKESRVVVVGGDGFIGSSLVEELLERGASVSVVVNHELERLGPIREKIKIFNDITLVEDYADIFNKNDIIFNFAAFKRNKKYHAEHPAGVLHKNIADSLGLLEAFSKSSAQKILNISSSSIESINGNIYDSESVSGHFGYAWSKKMLEVLSLAYAKEFGKLFYIARADNVYGENDDFTRFPQIIPSLISQALSSDKKIRIFGNGHQKRNFIYIKDLVSGLLDLVEFGPANKIIELSGRDAVSIKEAADEIVRLLATPVEIEFYGEDFEVEAEKNKNISAGKLFGFLPKTSFHDGIKKTVSWYIKKYERDKENSIVET